MDDHRSRKRRRHDRQEEPTPRYAAERRKPAQPADIGCDTPARRGGRDGAETRVNSHTDVLPENGYVYNWLAEVATEQRAQTQSPANGGPLFLPQTRGFRHPSPERYDETVPDEGRLREKRRDSTDSSLIQPAYEREEVPLREKTIGQVTSEDRTRHISKKAKKHKQLEASSTTDDSQSESDKPRRKETFEKRSRHKTKEDRYESKKARKHVIEDDKPAKKKVIKVKRGDAAKASRKAGEDLINGFRSRNVAQDRLTMRPGTGIFKNGRASSPSRNRGLHDLAFSEMQFLKQSRRQPVDSEKEVIISKSGQKTKRERERARNEISNYFIPVRQPLQEANINHGREAATLPSDAGKTEDTSVVRGHYSNPPVSPEKHQTNEKELYVGFSTRRSSPQKFSLTRPKLDQIFVPRNTTASNKSTSYCTWSESVRSPRANDKEMMADASRNKRGMSPTSRQRIPVRADTYKEVGIQAELDWEVDSPYNPALRRTRRDDNDTQLVVSKQLNPANTSSARDVNDQSHTECQDEDRIHQFQADRAVLHDCEPHRSSGRPDKGKSGKRLQPLHTESLRTGTPVGPNQDTDHAEQTRMEQCIQTGMGAIAQAQNGSVPPRQTNPNLDVHDIMSRAVLAQRAYINRRSTPKVAVEEARGTSDVRVLPTDVPSARGSAAPKKDNESLEIGLTNLQGENEASHLLSELVGDRRNEETSQPGQDQFHGSVPESNLPVYRQTQSEYIDAAGYQPNEPDGNRDYITGEHDSHQIENIATPRHFEVPKLIIPTRGFSTGAVHIPPVQSRTISPLETVEPIYARQLQNQAFDVQEEKHGLYNREEQGQGAVYLYEGGQWEREALNADAPQEYNPIEIEDGQVNYGDIYEGQQDELDLIHESMYYGEEQPIDAEAQMHHTTAPADNMLFYTPASGPSAGYQWMPRQRSYFSAAADRPDLGSWERVQTAVLSWRLSAHPITLLWFLGFRISSLLVYLFGLLFTSNFVLIFIITILLLAADFYYLKNIAGRRLVGLRWWNEVDVSTGDSQWVFESADPATKVVNATDSRFFWLAMYAQPCLWVALAVLAVVRFEFIWLTLVVIALVLTITNTLAFSRCDKFSHASNLAGSALYSGGLARNLAGGVVNRFFGGRS
ncbi:hypothetical protein V500_08873 [Pseudogymnoascus sp. VKM F-4518 (FW-2643)]|nr:hypothetical protein V500_08873 [Pseudogymnoascus sp. VKM F-4518 (FW-2643)]